MAALISKGPQAKRRNVVVVLGDGLKDAREEMFVIMVCDGLPLRLAFARAGYTSKDNAASSKLFALPRIQERAAAILEARRTTGVLSLPEVTDMLKRVFAGAHSEGEYSAAHNAAFSLARLYGHVTDRQTIEVMRRPSRDPDAPSEQMLEDWAASLPLVGSTGSSEQAQISALQGPPAPLLGPGPSDMLSADNIDRALSQPLPAAATDRSIANDFNGLAVDTSCLIHSGPAQLDLFSDVPAPADRGPGETGNGAPSTPVTGTPNERGGSEPLDLPVDWFNEALRHATPLKQKGAPVPERQVSGTPGEIPSFDELFG